MKMLQGLALKNYRGIGSDFNYMFPFGRVNFFIGPNNSGKSTVLTFIAKHLCPDPAHLQHSRKFDVTDIRVDGGGASPEFKFAVPKSEIIEVFEASHARFVPEIKRIISAIDTSDVLWVYYDMASGVAKIDYDPIKMEEAIHDYEWHSLFKSLLSMRGGDLDRWMKEVIGKIVESKIPTFEKPFFIPAIRQVSESGQAYDDMSGKGLIDKLAQLQNPHHLEQDRKKEFDKINNFLRTVISSATALIEIPHDRKHILVHLDGKVLPLSSLGTGVHEVIMIAAFCTLSSESIICIEEPEIHLHPILQRKLISYLHQETTNQYFIATHSPSLLDAVPASIFSVSNDNGETRIERVATSDERFEICKRLGYHASDLMQSNAVIWVEGPSDRIYLRHWINSCDPSLIEGVHYSIMFYGGRLLSHLSFDDPEVTEFINLRRLNRNSIVMIDSDKKNRPDSS